MSEVTPIKKPRNTRRVANPQHDVVLADGTVQIQLLTEYIEKTEIPILAEYCAEIGIFEEAILSYARDDEKTRIFLKILENKKRAALERKIYTSELNATIGANLLKTWREETVPERPPEYRNITLEEIDMLELRADELDTFYNLMHTAEFKIPANAKIGKLTRTIAQEKARRRKFRRIVRDN